jgi:hypothetical protein
MDNVVMQPVSRQRISKHIPAETDTSTTELLLEMVFYTRSVQSDYKEDDWVDPVLMAFQMNASDTFQGGHWFT